MKTTENVKRVERIYNGSGKIAVYVEIWNYNNTIYCYKVPAIFEAEKMYMNEFNSEYYKIIKWEEI